jgi:hypothetical protein
MAVHGGELAATADHDYALQDPLKTSPLPALCGEREGKGARNKGDTILNSAGIEYGVTLIPSP